MDGAVLGEELAGGEGIEDEGDELEATDFSGRHKVEAN